LETTLNPRTLLDRARGNTAITTAVYAVRHVAAGLFFAVAVAAFVVGLLAFALEMSMPAGVYLALFVVAVAAVALGAVCQPDNDRAAAEPVWGPDGPPGPWDDQAEERERLYKAPDFQPPHDYPLRPAVPPADPDHDR
jgi:hypothetical protein